MKIIDRYLLKNLLVPLAYCLAAFVLLIIVHDLFDNLGDFIDAQTPLEDVLVFYIFLLPSVFVLIMPVSLMLAVLYSLVQLTRNNELTAMRSSGVSLYRLMLPFMLVGVLAAVLVGIVNETVGPKSAYWAQQFLREQKHQESVHIATDLPYYNNIGRRNWFMEKFNTQTYAMHDVTVTQERADGTAKMKLQARGAQWLDGAWWFTDVAIQEYDKEGDLIPQQDADGKPLGSTRYERGVEMRDFDESPQDFLNEIKDPAFLSSRELFKFIQMHPLSEEATARTLVDLHHRLAMPWMSLVVTLLGIPFGAQTARKGAFTGVILCIGLFFGYYFLINIGLWLGKELLMPPWLAAWLPNATFLSIGLVLVVRMR